MSALKSHGEQSVLPLPYTTGRIPSEWNRSILTRVWYLADSTDYFARDDTLFTFDTANLQACILRLLKDFVPVKTIEGLRRVLICYLLAKEYCCSSWVKTDEAGKIVYFGVNNDPLRDASMAGCLT